MGLNYDEFLKELEYKNLRKTIVDLKTKIKHLEAKIKKQDEKEANYIKYLEGKIDKLKNKCASYGLFIDRDTAKEFDLQIKAYENILERLKGGKHER